MDDITHLTTNNIVTGIVVNLKKTKTKRDRLFTVTGEYYELIKSYNALRPTKIKTNRYFLNYQKGKCTAQPIGKNKIAGFPKMIAVYLNLPNVKCYTGHSFRRTSATLLCTTICGTNNVKRLGGWKSLKVAEEYTDESVGYRKEIENQIKSVVYSATDSLPSSSKVDTANRLICVPRQSTSSSINLDANIIEDQNVLHSTNINEGISSSYSTTNLNEQISVSHAENIDLFNIENAANINSTSTVQNVDLNVSPSQDLNFIVRGPVNESESVIVEGRAFHFTGCSNFNININHNYR